MNLSTHLPQPTDLPAWATTRHEALRAVMAHPADRIVTALEAVGDLDLPALITALDTQAVAA